VSQFVVHGHLVSGLLLHLIRTSSLSSLLLNQATLLVPSTRSVSRRCWYCWL